ncbi:MAG TPA: TRAM domain-containing protein [Caldilineae bacterium]|nr:TRAM domain-containing protein [Caldilineae bacterium]
MVRIIGLIVFGLIGWQVGAVITGSPSLTSGSAHWIIPSTAIGALIGALIAPWLILEPAAFMKRTIRQLPPQQILASTIGLAVGLVIAALLAWPLSLLPSPFGKILPMIGALVFGYLGITVMTLRQKEIFALFGDRWSALKEGGIAAPGESPVLLDTSVIIDGRIADISHTGFIPGPMIVPRFVLNELQYIADSPDPLRRNRGRRGLDMLNRMQRESVVPVRIVDLDVEDAQHVDEKLIRLAQRLHCPIVTNDFNLNRVAGLQGISVLNVNELANAVKVVVLPGETMRVHIIQEGKEQGQGVGYLDDGTMVVVENGRQFINQEIEVMVTKVLQTNAGRMIFAQPNGNSTPSSQSS